MEDIFVDTLEKKQYYAILNLLDKKKARNIMKQMTNEVDALMATKGTYSVVESAVDRLNELGVHNVMLRYELDREYGQALTRMCYVGTFDSNCQEMDCDNCPYNDGAFAGNGNLPCGQQNCWRFIEENQQ